MAVKLNPKNQAKIDLALKQIEKLKKKMGEEAYEKMKKKGDAELRKKEKQLLRSKEKYHTHAQEYIELWLKTKRALRGL